MDARAGEGRMKRSIVAQIQHRSELRDKARGKGPAARVAAMILDQIYNGAYPEMRRRVRPL